MLTPGTLSDKILAPNVSKIGISVLIPSKNEERSIADCIKSVSWVDEIFVLDSYSSDQTVEIAKKMGAYVIQRVFDDYSSNKNWALRNLPFKNDFLFILDADMIVTDGLREEIVKEIVCDPNMFGFYIPIRNYFNGKWIKHGGWYPNYHLMIFKHALAQVEDRLVHAHIGVKGAVKYLKNDILHLDHKGTEHFIDRHNRYSSLEAVEVVKYLSGMQNRREKNNINAPSWRRTMKEFSYRFMPCRSLAKFLWMYVIKRGFLDGRMGFRYCLLHAFYEYQISLKLEELSDSESPMHKKYKRYLTY